MNVAAWVRSNRVEKRWTQADLAQRMGTNDGAVSRWERGEHNPSLVQFRRLCVEFAASADDALGLTPKKSRTRGRA